MSHRCALIPSTHDAGELAEAGLAKRAPPSERAIPHPWMPPRPGAEHRSMPKPLARLSIDLRFSSTSRTASYTVKRVPDRRGFQIAEPSRIAEHSRSPNLPDRRGFHIRGFQTGGVPDQRVPDQRGSISEGRQIRGFQTPFQMTLQISTSTQKTLATL